MTAALFAHSKLWRGHATSVLGVFSHHSALFYRALATLLLRSVLAAVCVTVGLRGRSLFTTSPAVCSCGTRFRRTISTPRAHSAKRSAVATSLD